MNSMKKLMAASAVGVLAVLPLSAVAYANPVEQPTIGAPGGFTTFHVKLAGQPVGTWELSLWSDGVLLGRVFSSGPLGEEIAVETQPTASCTYQADVRIEPSGSSTFHFYSGARVSFPGQCG